MIDNRVSTSVLDEYLCGYMSNSLTSAWVWHSVAAVLVDQLDAVDATEIQQTMEIIPRPLLNQTLRHGKLYMFISYIRNDTETI